MENAVKCAVVWTSLLLVVACAPAPQEPEQPVEPPAPEAPAEAVASYPDPGEEVAQEVRDLVSGWVAERAAADGSYDIPPRAGHEVRGMMADFHTVHQKDADTYSVCVDFKSEAQLYDVDFFVDRTDEGLVVAEHFLHKIDGEAVE